VVFWLLFALQEATFSSRLRVMLFGEKPKKRQEASAARDSDGVRVSG
jgi:hypothetical protein